LVYPVCVVFLDLLEAKVEEVILVCLDQRVLPVSKVSEERRDSLDHRVLLEKLEVQETQDLQVHPVSLVQLV